MATPGEPVLLSLYVYAPNKAAPVFFAIAYALSAIFHVWQCYRYKAFKLIGLHPVCAILFTLGYALRAYSAHDNYIYSLTTKIPLFIFIFSQVFIFVCPPLLELANYHVVARVFHYIPYLAPLPPTRVMATFGGLMALVEALNAIGVALSANPSSSSESTQSLGSQLTLAAIGIQLAIIVIFIAMASIFHVRFRKTGLQSRSVSTVLWTLYTSMALIFVRCVYRLVEHMDHAKIELDDLEALRRLSPLRRYESYFYVFEATLMLLNSFLWNVWHPGRLLPREVHVYLGRDGREVIGQKERDDRGVMEKIGHVFTFGMLFRQKKTRTGQWQEIGEGGDDIALRATGLRP
ncbi:hypothetical protein QBC40DRAFT_272351 [Triangularia verruculosa]|uniref:RTA1 domain-containing protein n=1 Tax=Triangularia verruculosa TaxID=2587418 RepID=A0AAN6XS74_9PEZI|nr:hypothetical protein QBC40DRAFT_272351 [Triangularia verruculosa]